MALPSGVGVRFGGEGAGLIWAFTGPIWVFGAGSVAWMSPGG